MAYLKLIFIQIFCKVKYCSETLLCADYLWVFFFFACFNEKNMFSVVALSEFTII